MLLLLFLLWIIPSFPIWSASKITFADLFGANVCSCVLHGVSMFWFRSWVFLSVCFRLLMYFFPLSVFSCVCVWFSCFFLFFPVFFVVSVVLVIFFINVCFQRTNLQFPNFRGPRYHVTTFIPQIGRSWKVFPQDFDNSLPRIPCHMNPPWWLIAIATHINRHVSPLNSSFLLGKSSFFRVTLFPKVKSH